MQREEQVEEGEKKGVGGMETGKEDGVRLYHEFMTPLPLFPKSCITGEFHVPVEIVRVSTAFSEACCHI